MVHTLLQYSRQPTSYMGLGEVFCIWFHLLCVWAQMITMCVWAWTLAVSTTSSFCFARQKHRDTVDLLMRVCQCARLDVCGAPVYCWQSPGCVLQEAVITPVSPDVLYLFRVQAVCMNDMRSDFSQSMLFRGDSSSLSSSSSSSVLHFSFSLL